MAPVTSPKGKVEAASAEAVNMIYRGEWKLEMRHGYGVQEFYDGSRFEGHWVYNNQKFGTYVWPDGAEYSGDFNGPIIEG